MPRVSLSSVSLLPCQMRLLNLPQACDRHGSGRLGEQPCEQRCFGWLICVLQHIIADCYTLRAMIYAHRHSTVLQLRTAFVEHLCWSGCLSKHVLRVRSSCDLPCRSRRSRST